ncbi:MAG: hypothetical protein IJX28_08115 [Clostridia bacterium]|nr:hypothetical protein [Clostridia bacterium]
MKPFYRLLITLLALLLVLTSVSSCSLLLRLPDATGESLSSTTNSTVVPATTEAEEEWEDIVLDGDASWMHFDLNDADEEAFLAALDQCLELMKNNAADSEIEAAVENMENLFYHIATQAQIAYIFYSKNAKAAGTSDAYLYSSTMQSDAYDAYMKMCQQIDTSDFAYRDTFFADWSESEIAEMRMYSDEMSEISKENDELLVEYRDALELEDTKAMENKVREIYQKVVENNNQLAVGSGHQNYAEYAYSDVYLRDYTLEDMEDMRAFVKNYLVPLCKDAYQRFQLNYQKLPSDQQNLLVSLLYAEHDTRYPQLMKNYFASLPESMGNGMMELFTTDHAIFAMSYDSYEGAFTTYLYEYEHPICFFGPGYKSATTVAHEAGHYYAYLYADGGSIPMDLAEVHSQANEWLFMIYLEDILKNEELYQVLIDYQLYYNISSIILCTIIDEFEQSIYENPELADPSKIDAQMTAICEGYGGEKFVDEYLADVSLYWKHVVVENPMYYISYAMSGLASLEIYCLAIEDYANSIETYRKLTEEADLDAGFTAILNSVGLRTPFDETLYQSLAELLK